MKRTPLSRRTRLKALLLSAAIALPASAAGAVTYTFQGNGTCAGEACFAVLAFDVAPEDFGSEVPIFSRMDVFRADGALIEFIDVGYYEDPTAPGVCTDYCASVITSDDGDPLKLYFNTFGPGEWAQGGWQPGSHSYWETDTGKGEWILRSDAQVIATPIPPSVLMLISGFTAMAALGFVSRLGSVTSY
jgi:hypothetical protein